MSKEHEPLEIKIEGLLEALHISTVSQFLNVMRTLASSDEAYRDSAMVQILEAHPEQFPKHGVRLVPKAKQA
jgi:hypothetical protein